jgi:imidazolonepropionase-like amidohydrolase
MKKRLANSRLASGLAPLLCAGFISTVSHAQSRQVPAPPQSAPIVIQNATIHPVSSPAIESGYVVLKDGVIDEIGTGEAPDILDSTVVDASGFHLYPGLIAAESKLGLIETGDVDVTIDHRELGSFRPEVRAAVAINPDTDLIPVARNSGILTALTLPGGGLVSGRCSIIRLDGWTWEDMAIDDSAGLVLNWPNTEPIRAPWMRRGGGEQRQGIAEQLAEIDRTFDEADAYFKAREHEKDVTTDLRYEAMRDCLAGNRPLFVWANSVGQIESAITWANKRGYKIVIIGGSEADRALPILKKHDVPVIIYGTHRMPTRRHDAYDRAYALPRMLHEAGVKFCIAPGGRDGMERTLGHQAATAAAYGLPREEALRSVTLSAAEILGIGATHGSIERGKAATVILTTGDPLEISTEVVMAFIDGRRIDLTSRHTQMYEKYRQKYKQKGLIE